MNDLISVVVPVYNVEKTLERCIESIQNQTYQNIEILLINDGSKDSSLKICEKYAKKDKRIHVFSKENGGLSSARNMGIDNMKGKYVTFVDSDDYIDPVMIEELYKLLKSKPSISMAICPCHVVRKQHQEIKKVENPQIIYYTNLELCDKIQSFISGGVGEVAWGKLYDVALFENTRYTEGMINEDVAIIHELYYNCNKAVFTSQPYYYYCVYDTNSIMRSKYSIKKLDLLKALEKRMEFYQGKNEYLLNKTRKEYCNAIGANYYLVKRYIKDSQEIQKTLKEKYNQTYRQLDKSTLSFSYKIRLFIARYFLTFYGRVMEWNHNRMERKWKREV